MTSEEQLRLLAPDLTSSFPRSPREMLAGYESFDIYDLEEQRI